MDQNQVIDNQNVDNDLQKAIDNITSSTSIDPVFSDPVAAPSSIPEGDNGELGEPVGPFPEPKAIINESNPEPIAPLESVNTPEINNFIAEQTPVIPKTPFSPTPIETPIPEIPSPKPEISHPEQSPQLHNTAEIKKAALRDLFPVLGKININALQKFKIYRNIFEELKDYTVLESAYEAAREIPDETARAEALLYLVEAIDNI